MNLDRKSGQFDVGSAIEHGLSSAFGGIAVIRLDDVCPRRVEAMRMMMLFWRVTSGWLVCSSKESARRTDSQICFKSLDHFADGPQKATLKLTTTILEM